METNLAEKYIEELAAKFENQTEEEEWEDFQKAKTEGLLFSGEGVLEKAIAVVKERMEHKKTMYSFRLKTSTVDKIKLKAKKANVPYQTYVNAILGAVAAAE